MIRRLSLLLMAMAFVLPQIAISSQKAVFESAKVCGECHGDIYNNWKKSLHALSYTNPIFTNAYRKAYTDTAGKAKEYCLNCHAPTVVVTGDYGANLPITAEGVTCDFCHTITKIHLNGGNSTFVNKPGKTKISVLKNADSKHHKTKYSADFASSKLCAGCHDFKNRHNVHVGVTYSEWKKSSFAKEGKHCQSCHMPEVSGKTANEGGRNKIHDHSLSHNVESMKDAVTVRTLKTTNDGKRLKTKIKITNAKAGHSIPTGTPARLLILEVRTIDEKGNTIEKKKRTYSKVIVTKDNREVREDGEVFLYGRRIAADNRLQAGESRIENFLFTSNLGKVKKIIAKTYFMYRPLVTTEVEMKISISETEQKVDKTPLR